MSANGATEQRSSFQRWVASLKRESQPDTASTVAAVPGVRPKRDDDATRVHRVPKDILLRLQARAAASAAESLNAERTAVFHAPPELLERAKGMVAAGRVDPATAAKVDPATAAEEELTHPLPVPGVSSAADASAESSTILDFQDSTEAASGISQRPQGLGPRTRVEAEGMVASAVPADSLEPASSPAPSSQAPSNDDSATVSRDVPAARSALNSDVDELLSSVPVLVEESQGVVDSIDRASEPPQFRRRSGPTLVLIALLALAAAAWFVFAQS